MLSKKYAQVHAAADGDVIVEGDDDICENDDSNEIAEHDHGHET
jgi:hypothetical protein